MTSDCQRVPHVTPLGLLPESPLWCLPTVGKIQKQSKPTVTHAHAHTCTLNGPRIRPFSL